MFSEDSLREIKVIKQDDRKKITLTEDSEGKKYLLKEFSGDKREIYKVLQKITHKGIPKIYYIGFDDKTTVVIEYIEGELLSSIIEQNKKLSKKQIVLISKEILSILSQLHKNKLIHKDIKPDNIIIDKSGQPWLIDYDIARIYRQDIRKDTETIGTFGYAPIEQFGMLPTDYKTDIYAFGMTLKTLLHALGIKGYLQRIADKCTKLDPSQRYQSADAVKKAITMCSVKYPLCGCAIAVLLIVFLISRFLPLPANNEKNNLHIKTTSAPSSTTPMASPDAEKEMPAQAKNPTEEASKAETAEPKPAETDFEGTFYGFDFGANETIYRKYDSFSDVCVFSLDSPREHIIFVDDMTKRGKIKLGEKQTVIDAEMILKDGVISITLKDAKGHSFSHQFRYSGQYTYEQSYQTNIRKNADIICHDFDTDGGTELLIGLNEGSIGIMEDMFYNNFNYCMAWCIDYDENNGFTLCEGDMFSKGYAFMINSRTNKLNISWEDFGDITGYCLVDGKIEAVH